LPSLLDLFLGIVNSREKLLHDPACGNFSEIEEILIHELSGSMLRRITKKERKKTEGEKDAMLCLFLPAYLIEGTREGYYYAVIVVAV